MYSFCAPPLSLSLRVLKAILWIKHRAHMLCVTLYMVFLEGITPINPYALTLIVRSKQETLYPLYNCEVKLV